MAEEGERPSSQSHPMSGGAGPNSYARNSVYQRGIVEASKGMIDQAIEENLDIDNLLLSDTSNLIQIADLGCSVGPNTFLAVQNIIQSIQSKFLAETNQNLETLQFQVYFNDQIENDFNTLFKSLPPGRGYSVAGIPGTFHGRLFPNCSLHLIHTSYSIHWLSKVPSEILNPESSAWNKDSIYCTGFVKEVAEAYLDQFKKDMKVFLNARAQELVPGGLLVILGSGLPDGVPMSRSKKGPLFDYFGSCLFDMARKGLLNKENVESFNLPLYFPHVGELKEVIEENGSFSIETMGEIVLPVQETANAEFLTSMWRAITEGLVKNHFGDDAVDEIFDYFLGYFKKCFSRSIVVEKDIEYCVVLKRNLY